MPATRMRDQAEHLGFAFNRTGCPCNGSPRIYNMTRDNTLYTLTIWERRNVWQLKTKGCVIATGKAEELTTKIQKIWDL